MKKSKVKENSKQEEIVKITRELDKIWKKQRKLGFHLLAKPIQRGWVAKLAVREDILRCSDGYRYLNILPYVQNYWTSRTTNFNVKPNEDVCHPQGRNIADHGPRSISEKQMLAIVERFGEHYKKYFHSYQDWGRSINVGTQVIVPTRYRIARPHVFKTIIEKNYINRLPIISPTLDSQEKRLRNRINALGGNEFVYGRYYYREDRRNDLIIRQLEKEVRKELNLKN